MAHHRGRPGGDAKGHCMFTHVTHVGQTVVICCRSLWERYGLMQGRDFARHTGLLL